MTGFPSPKLGMRTFDARIEFNVYQQPDVPPAGPGVYALLSRIMENGRGLVAVLWMGESEDVSTVSEGHPELPKLVENGFNAVAAFPEADPEARKKLLDDLLYARQVWPRCQPQPDDF